MRRPKAAYPTKFLASAMVAGKMRTQGVALCSDTCARRDSALVDGA